MRLLANENSTPSDFNRPGHVFPLRAHPDGVLGRGGHTEAAVDLCRLSGLVQVGVISEIVLDDGQVARRDDLIEMAREWNIKMITIDDLKEYRINQGK